MNEEMIDERVKRVAEAIAEATDSGGDWLCWIPEAEAAIAAYNPNERLREALEAIADDSKGTEAWNHIPIVQRMRQVAREALSPLPQGED